MCVLVFGAVIAPKTAHAARSKSPNASIDVSSQQVAIGDVILVTPSGWPDGPVTMSVCGNDGRRGSADCDLLGSQAVRVNAGTAQTFELRITRPPVPCPCVVRVSSTADQIVRSIPVVVAGVATAPTVGDASTTPKVLQVSARLDEARGFGANVASAFAGPSKRRVLVTVRNAGTAAVDAVTVSAVVGRDSSSGTPVGSRVIAQLPPGARETVDFSVTIGAPAFGDYVVFGDVSTPSTTSEYSVSTSSDPWALWLLVPICLFVAARVLRRREKARATATVAPLVVGPNLARHRPHCSPDVGVRDGLRCPSAPYAPDGRVSAPNGVHDDARAVEPINV